MRSATLTAKASELMYNILISKTNEMHAGGIFNAFFSLKYGCFEITKCVGKSS